MIAGKNETIRQTTLFSSQVDEGEQQSEEIDFKMVTFSLGGKEYGVDIMKVKEIAKYETFTYVPNTPPYVTGVYNLRGDIISVIDLRIMFGLPAAQRREGDPDDGLILRLDSGLIGVVVDSIDRVIGISSQTIQPPHPIFADVNIKYISGVVEHDSSLYIILDVERILGEGADDSFASEPTSASRRALPDAEQPRSDAPAERREPETAGAMGGALAQGRAETAEMVAQTLQTLSGFTMTEINRAWVERRLGEWQTSHDGNVQITTQDEVDEFLGTFSSPYSGRFWENDYLDALRSLLPIATGQLVNAWNPGCGQGHEAYSLACLLRSSYPDARVKVWASDNDLLNVSTAPNLVFERRAVPDYYEPFIVQGSNGYSFGQEIKELILFEFSDVTHATAVPPADVIVIRDLLSFLPEQAQRRVIAMIEERAKESTVIVTGGNEDLSVLGTFTSISDGAVRAFQLT